MGELGNNRKIRKMITKERLISRMRYQSSNKNNDAVEFEKNTDNIEPNMTEESFFYQYFNKGSDKIKSLEIFPVKINNEFIDISIVIPIRGRTNQLPTVLLFLKKEIALSDLKVRIIVVENDDQQINKKACEDLEVDYTFIRSEKSVAFNKCLCHNVGSLVHNSKYILFHDVDLIPPSNFFKNLMLNKGDKKAIQCFHKRRVIYVNEILSNTVRKKLSTDELCVDDKDVKIGKEGAPGGSIMVERNLFENIGGFDHNLFWGYSIEDGFFWKKLEANTEIIGSDNPPIEMYHLWHEPTHGTNPNILHEHKVYNIFLRFKESQKIDYFKKSYEEYIKLKNRYVIK